MIEATSQNKSFYQISKPMLKIKIFLSLWDNIVALLEIICVKITWPVVASIRGCRRAQFFGLVLYFMIVVKCYKQAQLLTISGIVYDGEGGWKKNNRSTQQNWLLGDSQVGGQRDERRKYYEKML